MILITINLVTPIDRGPFGIREWRKSSQREDSNFQRGDYDSPALPLSYAAVRGR